MRRRLLPLTVAVFALVLGLVLGASLTAPRLLGAMTADRDRLAGQVSALRAQAAGQDAARDATERFVGANGPATVRGALAGRSVAVVSAADTDPADAAAVTDLLGRAGAQVTGRLELTDAMLAPERAESVRALVPRLLPAGTPVPTAADPGAQVGSLLAAVVTTRGRATPPAEAVTALTGLADAGLIRPVPPVAPAPAQLVLVLAGPSTDLARGTTLAHLASVLDHAGLGAVLAGRSVAGGDVDAAVAAARADPASAAALTVVDGLATPSARVAAVLGLRDQAQGIPAQGRGGVPGAP